jgi:1,4-alpha-glucan branching enzyme
MTNVSRDGVVEFRFYRPQVRQVAVVGCFTGWRADAMPMSTQGDGWWHASAMLGAGDYRFRYLADGVWYPDYAANGIEQGKTGCDSLLVVPGLRTTPQKPTLRQTA